MLGSTNCFIACKRSRWRLRGLGAGIKSMDNSFGRCWVTGCIERGTVRIGLSTEEVGVFCTVHEERFKHPEELTRQKERVAGGDSGRPFPFEII